MSTTFPTATEYMRGTMPQVRDATIGEQPNHRSPSEFGKQPEGFRNRDFDPVTRQRRRILVVGGGDVWNRFARAALEHRGAELFMYDPKLLEDAPEAAEKKANTGIEADHFVSSDDTGEFPEVPEGIDAVVVLTPPEYHAGYIKWAQDRHLPAIVEKPLVADVNDFKELDDRLQTHATAPVYCMDWKAAHALPLAAVIAHAMHQHTPHADAIPIDASAEAALKQFDFNHIEHIKGSMVEVASEQGSMEFLKKNREAIYKQGVLKDMGVHPMAALTNMGFEPGEVHKVWLGDTDGQQEPGVYRRIGNGEKTPAWYGRAEMMSRFNGQEIPTVIEAAKAGGVTQDFISLIDCNGHVLRWEYSDGAGHVTLAANETVTTIATANIDPYALMFDQALHFFDTQKEQPKKSALYYHEQRAILHAVNKMEEMGRQVPAAATDQVRQLALEPQLQVDLSKATITGPAAELTQPL